MEVPILFLWAWGFFRFAPDTGAKAYFDNTPILSSQSYSAWSLSDPTEIPPYRETPAARRLSH